MSIGRGNANVESASESHNGRDGRDTNCGGLKPNMSSLDVLHYLMGPRGNTAWTEQAACKTLDPRIFDEDNPNNAQAMQICASCPVRAVCLSDANQTGSEGVIRGGTLDTRRPANRSGPPRQSHCNRGHNLSGTKVAIRENGRRVCLECAYARAKAYRARKKAKTC